MSGNLLSKNHPFRASVTHGSAEIPSTAPVQAAPVNSEDKTESRYKFSTKTKLISFAILGLIITYGWIQIYDSIYPPTKKSNKTSVASKEAPDKISYEEVTDFEWGISEIEFDQTESKPSWFKQTFCKGVKRSFFCR